MKKNVTAETYHSQFIPVDVREDESTVLLVYPQMGVSKHEVHFVTRVQNNECWIPIANDSSSRRERKTGMLLGTYELVSEERVQQFLEEGEVKTLREIQNDLVPQVDTVSHNGTRREKLLELIEQQKCTHLSNKQREKLKAAILEYDELFISEKRELGLLNSTPAKITVADPQPV